MTVLATARLRLRPVVLADAPALHAAFADPGTMRWWSSGPHLRLAETEAYVAHNADAPDCLCRAIVEGDGPALGWVNLMDRRPGVKEIGYILVPQARGRGVALEAVTAVLDAAFADPALRRVYADTDPDNDASIGLLERLGFVREGHLRAEWETHIGVRDSLIFGLLREEWVGRLTSPAG